MIWIKKLPRSLWNVKEQLHTTYMYPLPNIISWGPWETSTVWILWHYQSKTQACIYSQLPIIRSREIEKSLSYQEFELLGV